VLTSLSASIAPLPGSTKLSGGQYKIAFICPTPTPSSAPSSHAHLVNSATGLYNDLGVMSIVSTNVGSDQFIH
jgi:hypothetical protein